MKRAKRRARRGDPLEGDRAMDLETGAMLVIRDLGDDLEFGDEEEELLVSLSEPLPRPRTLIGAFLFPQRFII